jgi:hypothetical protein
MISIVFPAGVSRIARSTLWASSMSMCRRIGIPSSESVSCRWMSVMTVALRFDAIAARRRRRVAAINCCWTRGWSELTMKKSQIASQGCTGVA